MERLLAALARLVDAMGSMPSDEDALEIYRSLEFSRDTSASFRAQLRSDDDIAA